MMRYRNNKNKKFGRTIHVAERAEPIRDDPRARVKRRFDELHEKNWKESASFDRNHEPSDQGVWIPYTGFRFKTWYNVKLHNGTIAKGCQPNGSSFYPCNDRPHYGIKDYEVAEVMVTPDDEVKELGLWGPFGQERIDDQIELFGEPE